MTDIERLIRLLARLPGLGPRSARRAALHLIRKRDTLLDPLARAMADAAANIQTCGTCGNIDATDPCAICTDPKRDQTLLCVVEGIADLWALNRSDVFSGRFHVLGGVLSALDGVGPEDLSIGKLVERAQSETVTEVILATNMTVDGQTTAHYVSERLSSANVRITRLAHGVPVGGELDYLDDGTLSAALRARHE
ncbi:MAG: recombination protein RecR [Alphaproteobacteria bacterium]|nr:recombination protein RecR [Alphaproteobacteria bacterium]